MTIDFLVFCLRTADFEVLTILLTCLSSTFINKNMWIETNKPFDKRAIKTINSRINFLPGCGSYCHLLTEGNVRL